MVTETPIGHRDVSDILLEHHSVSSLPPTRYVMALLSPLLLIGERERMRSPSAHREYIRLRALVWLYICTKSIVQSSRRQLSL